MTLLSVRREVGEFKKRYKWMTLVVILVFGGLFARMIQLQLLEHQAYAQIARENITRTIHLPATRGIVRDAEGRIVATNRPAYTVYITPQHLREGEDDLETISELMGLDDEQRAALRDGLDAIPARRRTHQIRFFSDITRDQLAALETHQRELPAVDVVAEPVRTYPFGALASHALGYLNEMTAEELARLRDHGYHLGDRVGRTGIERAWESYLRGRRGFRRVHVDARHRRVENVAGEHGPMRREPVPGRDITLTLDMELMRIVERAFRGHPSGAAAIVDVRTGQVRALFSKPSYDLGEFTGGLRQSRYVELRDNPFRPLLDKTIYESFFPGSVLKPITALASLRHGADPNARIECQGLYQLGSTDFRCTAVHGEVNMRQAIVQSCNVYFYRLAEQVGLNRLARVAGDFGLGRRTGVGINAEAAGFIPTREWYERQPNRRFRIGYTLNTAIGQGDTKTTLVQLVMAYAAIANGGTLYVPQLVDRVTSPDGSVVEEFEPRVRRRVHARQDHLALVIDGLYGVVNDSTGTAFEVRIEGGVPIAGKTGTAQVSHRSRPGEDPARAWYFNRAHAWFAGFAPAYDPELAIVILVEHGGAGGRNAAPIAIQILQEYLGNWSAPDFEGEAADAAPGQR